MNKSTKIETQIKTKVESFELDHDLVLAPYVRLIAVEGHPYFDEAKISNFDIRFTQPNVQFIDDSSLHTLEHCLAGLLRDRISGLIDASPFGCNTGFHAIFWGTPSVEEVAAAYTSALEALVSPDFKCGDVPGYSRKECGNYRMHSLRGAKEWARQILEQKFSLDPFERVLP